MGIIADTRASVDRIPEYAKQMKAILSRHGVHGVDDLKRVAKDPFFRSEIAALWNSILTTEGGKLSLTVILSTVALAMGGVGIAAGGGAIGLPLLLILGPVGYFGGQELDSEGYTKAAVDKFRELLQMARKFDSEQYTGVASDRLKKLLEKAHEVEREHYGAAVVGRVKKLLGKTRDDQS